MLPKITLEEFNKLKEEINKKLEEKMARWEYLEELNQKIIKYKENKYRE